MSTDHFRVRSLAFRVLIAGTVLALGQLPAAPAAHAAPGDLDYSFGGFGSGGTVILRKPSGWSTEAMALHPDGRIVTVGRAGPDLLVMRFLSNGRQDPTFGDGGEVTIPNGQYRLVGEGVAIQEDGRIVVAGTISDPVDAAGADFFVARLTEAGELDETFGQQGLVFTDFRNDDDGAHAVAIQPDGKIVAAGHARIAGDDDFAVARYNPNGSLDTSFSEDGKAAVGFGGNDRADALVLQPDGKLVLAGTKEGSLDNDFAVARLNFDGSQDSSFGGDGEVVTGFGGLIESGHAVAIQPDGKVVVAGSGIDDVYVARYMPNGDLDNSFDGDGKRSISSNRANVHGVAVQPDGMMVLLGDRDGTPGDDVSDPHMVLWRLIPDGTLDTTFNGNGFLEVAGGLAMGRAVTLLADGRILGAGTYIGEQKLVRLWADGSYDTGGKQALGWDEPGFPAGSIEITHGTAVQPDGKILVAGEVQNAARTESDASLARFLPDGRPDTSFGNYGRLSFGFGVHNGARAVAVQPDGKIVAAGFYRSGQNINFMVARFLPDGSVDNTFALVGQNLVDFMGGVDWGWALALAPDGKIVVAGEAFGTSQTVFGVARFNSDGTLDRSFTGDGTVLIEYASGLIHWATSVVVQPDLKIVVAGQVGDDFALTRLHENGNLDRTFGTSGWTITPVGGLSRLNALARNPVSGYYLAVGTRVIDGDSDFAAALYTPDGLLDVCPAGTLCTRWANGTAFLDWGLRDYANSLDWRSDGAAVIGGCIDGRMAWAQLRFTLRPGTVLTGTADFPGPSECAAGVRFTGTNRLVLAGSYLFQGDRNLALAKFEVPANTSIGTATPSPTHTVTSTPTATPTASPTASATATSTVTATPTATPSTTTTATHTATPSTTSTGTITTSPSATLTKVLTSTSTPTARSTADPTFRIYLPQTARN